METKHPSIAKRSYEDFDPFCKWRREEGRDTLEAHLPGFRREHVRVQVNHLGFLVISGETPLIDGTRWRRFKKEIEIPPNCNANAVHATFMQSILRVVMPKKLPPISHGDQESETQIPESEPQKDRDREKERDDRQSMEFEGRGTRTREEKSRSYSKGINEAVGEDDDVDAEEEEFEGKRSAELTPEATREVCFKILVVVIVILVIGSYVTDMCKNMMADSYFLN